MFELHRGTTSWSHRALPFPSGPCLPLGHLWPIKNLLGTSDSFTSAGSADKGPSVLSLLTEISRLTAPTPYPAPGGLLLYLMMLICSLGWDFCFAYPGAFYFFIFKITLNTSVLIYWFLVLCPLFQIHEALLTVCLTVHLFPMGPPKQHVRMAFLWVSILFCWLFMGIA